MSESALSRLLKGFEAYRKDEYKTHRGRIKDLVDNGQHPEVMMIACSDSRSGPSLITRANPGDVFVGRRVAALVPPYNPKHPADPVAAEIEYAVEHLKVKDMVVLGHSRCGGIAGLEAAMKDGGDDKGSATLRWVLSAREVIARADRKGAARLKGQDRLAAIENESVLWSLENLMTYPSVKKAVKAGRLKLHGWKYDIEHAAILGYDAKARNWSPLTRVAKGLDLTTCDHDHDDDHDHPPKADRARPVLHQPGL
ncbi:MAG: carbonic anhydrase [Alphaproteobacteria bacterium]